MLKEDCFYLGKIAKKHSFKGELLLFLDTDEPEIYENLESVFIELNDEDLVPFFIESGQLHRNHFLRVQFEDVYSEEDADALVGTEVYLPLSMLPKLEGNQFYYHEIKGFEVIDEDHGAIGKLTLVNDNGVQPLFVINDNEKEILVPVIDEFIVKIDRENKQLHLRTPKGLIDLYL